MKLANNIWLKVIQMGNSVLLKQNVKLVLQKINAKAKEIQKYMD
jgi:hypothetical protein